MKILLKIHLKVGTIKRLMYSKLTDIKETLGFNYVLDGMIMDDLEDFRPGLKARDEFKVRSVLQEAKLYKTEVRELSKNMIYLFGINQHCVA